MAGAGQDIGAWQSPVNIWNRMNSENEIIVDSKDKEAWPSIGDKSETASEAGDTDSASVNSGSVISSSSFPGQSQLMGESGKGSSAIQAQSASMVWGASLSGDSKMSSDKNSTWGQPAVSTSSMSQSGWGVPSSTAESTMSANNQGSNMQVGQTSVADKQTSESSLGWVIGDPQQSAQNNTGGSTLQPTPSVADVSSAGPTSGAGITTTQSGATNAMQWNGLNFSSALPSFKEAADQDSTWGNVSKGNSVIGTGLNNSAGASGGSKDSISSSWGTNLSNSLQSSGWGTPPATSEMVGGGWGSPNPSPNPDAGTEGWGNPNQARGSNSGGNWGQQSQTSSSGWDHGSASSGSSSSGWGGGDSSRPPSNEWGQPPSSSSPSTWAQLDVSKPQNPAAAAWGQQDNRSQWGASGASQGVNQWGNVTTASTIPPQQQQTPASQHPQGAWGCGNPFTNPSNSAARVTPSQTGPSTWAQAAGKGLPPAPTKPPKQDLPGVPGATGGAPMGRPTNKDEYIAQAVNCNEGWGKRPISQDTAWDLEESPKPPRKVSTSSNESNENNSQWNKPNNGTSIWEGNKDGTQQWGRPQPQPQPANSLEWVSDNDGKEWQGPPGSRQQVPPQQPSNTWGPPPPPPPQPGPSNWGDTSRTTPGPTTGSNQWGATQDWPNNNGGMWNGPGGQQANMMNSSNNNQWGGDQSNQWNQGRRGSTDSWGDASQTETGTWGGNQPRKSSISNWGDGPEASEIKQAVAQGGHVNNGTEYWGDPSVQSRPTSNWTTPNTPSPSMEKDQIGMWGGPPTNNNKGQSWSSEKRPDGPGMWGNPPQGPGGGWGDNWNSGQKPKTPGPNWGGETGDWNPQPKKESWDDSSSNVWGANRDNDMGSWEDGPESSATWSSAKMKSNKPTGNFPVTTKQPPQMRIQLIQQLVNMGFKKEDAQKALIDNDMNMPQAIADLRKAGYEDGINRNINDNSPLVPPISNTLSSAQPATLPNSLAINKQGASLPTSSSLSGPNVPASINQNLQQKHVPPQLPATQPAAVMRNQIPMQQQLVQQQLLKQLQHEVQLGHINPQILNPAQLTPNMMVMVQQLIQLERLQSQLQAQQRQRLIQPGNNPNLAQADQLAIVVQRVKQQINLQLQQINQALQQMSKQQQPQVPQQQPQQNPQPVQPTENKDMKGLSESLSGVSIKDGQPQQVPQPPTSRLAQWKKSSGDESIDTLNKAVGSKPIQQSMSSPNLPAKLGSGELGSSTLLGLDSSNNPWSASASNKDWPDSSAIGKNLADHPGGKAKDGKESLGQTSPSSAMVNSASTSNLTDMIPEFVPGQPWAGLQSMKSVEEDPHMTPSSVARSLSVNTIRSDTLAKSTSGPKSADNTSIWSSRPGGGNMSMTASTGRQWSSGANQDATGWAGNQGNSHKPRPPPGLLNRSISAPGDHIQRNIGFVGGGVSWDRSTQKSISGWLVLKNLTPQIDGATLKTLCMQHGPLLAFYQNINYGQALVRYSTTEEAIKAQKSLNSCPLGNAILAAEFANDADVAHFFELNASLQGGISSTNLWSQPAAGLRPTPVAMKGDASQWNGIGGLQAGGMWGSGSLWAPAMDDHPGADTSLIPGGILGGQPT